VRSRTLRECDLAGTQRSLGHTLYLHFSVFVAETLAHMAYEERVVQPLLERLFTPHELFEMHTSIILAITPDQMMRSLRSIIPASTREERVEILRGGKQSAPAHVFAGILAQLCPLLTPEDAADLRARLEA